MKSQDMRRSNSGGPGDTWREKSSPRLYFAPSDRVPKLLYFRNKIFILRIAFRKLELIRV